jgi:adenylate cyclase
LPLPSLPSIAVLPFNNLSSDPGQEYFTDGLTDNLITGLSRLPGVFVISRNSAFFYKGKTVTVQQVGRELGVRTILQGSVLSAGGWVRINAELADATTGPNLWAQGFDQPLKDIFTIEDDITREIVTTLSLMFKLRNLQVPQVVAPGPTNNLQAFDDFLRGVEYQWRFTEQGNAKARELFQTAVQLDPKYADAYAGIGGSYLLPVLYSWTQNWQADLKLASEFSEKALALDDSNLVALMTLVWVDVLEFKEDQAVAYAERAVALNPNYAGGYEILAEALIFDWKPQEALPYIQKALRLDPKSETFYVFDIGFADLFMGRYAEAAQMFEKHLAVVSQSTEYSCAAVHCV